MTDRAWRGNGREKAGAAQFVNGQAVKSGFTNTYDQRPAGCMIAMNADARDGTVEWDRNRSQGAFTFVCTKTLPFVPREGFCRIIIAPIGNRRRQRRVSEKLDSYPGEFATAVQILRLADEYRHAAEHLLELGRRGDPLSRAPYRLSAIHAIELYLNALLLHTQHSPAQIRGMQHNLSKRIELAIAKGLRLRKRTEAHLLTMTSSREYLATRYDAEMKTTTSQINRLTATLKEVSGKTIKIVEPTP